MSQMRPFWTPTSYADAAAQVTAGQVQESHYFEAKRLIDATPRGTAKIGKALSAFSTDGGTFAIGLIEDDKTGVVAGVHLVPLKGLQERVSQIALQCDPPVVLPEMTELRANPTDDDGLLLVHILPSADAPHMYDGRFYGRDQRRSYPLSRPEVDRLLQLRSGRAELATSTLDTFIHARRASAWEANPNPWLAVVMLPAPTPANDRMLMRYLGGDYENWVRQLVKGTSLHHGMAKFKRTATGVQALVSTDRCLEVLDVDRDGTIRYGTDDITNKVHNLDTRAVTTYLHWRAVNLRVVDLVEVANRIGDQVGIRYGLRIATALRNIEGLPPQALFDESDFAQRQLQRQPQYVGYHEVAYQAAHYRGSSEFHPLEPGERREHLIDRLFSPLYNSMGMPPYLEHPDVV